MKLYTKTGDKGLTSLIGGTRVQKNDIRIEAYGSVDELNSYIGLLSTYDLPSNVSEYLIVIQNQLFSIGSYLATDQNKVGLSEVSLIHTSQVKEIEHQIDLLSENVPELEYFVLPGGSSSGALCHVCRTVTRRVERRLFDISDNYHLDENLIIFINRLSDYFFALSRNLTINSGHKEVFWGGHRIS
jgi:cob(I)alamin adenosyltransferase